MRKKRTEGGRGSEWTAAPGDRISPTDVQEMEFTVARFGGGYRMREVDEFLDRVTDTISALVAENEQLRAGGGSVSAGGAAPRPSVGADRAAVDDFLRRERGFLLSLGGLVQGHAEELKEMVRQSRRGPAQEAAADEVPSGAEAPVAMAAAGSLEPPTPQEPGAPAPQETEAPPIVVADDVDRPGEGQEPPDAAAAADRLIRLEEPETVRSRRQDPKPDGSLRELFWGEE